MELIITTILSNVASVGIAGYLFKLWIDKRLTHSLEKELEAFKSELAKDVARDSIQQQWVNDKRMALFAELNDLMLKMDGELKLLFFYLRSSGNDLASHAEKFCETYVEINAVIHRNEIFLNSETIEVVLSSYRPYFDLAENCMETGKLDEETIKALPKSLKELVNMANEPRKRIIENFRKMAGINA